jgi:hypothetical protein
MALKAIKTGTAPQTAQAQAPVQEAPAQQVAATPAPAQQPVAEAPAQQAAVAPAAQGSTAVGKPVSASEVSNLNAGILEGVDDLGGSGNYVTVDGTNFLYKSTNETPEYIDLVVAYGKRFYQWVDESNPERKVFNNSDAKLDDRYKLKFEIKWFEDREEAEATEFTQTLSTTSAMNFIDYLKKLAAGGLGVGQVVTRLSVSRQQSRDGKNRYSRVEMEALDYADYVEKGEIKSLGVKTPDAKAFA